MGINAMAVWPVGDLFAIPILMLTRESSLVTSGGGDIEGSGWSLGTAFAVDIPLTGRFGFTPEVGYTKGSVRTDLISSTGAGRLGITDSLTGWWGQAEFSLSF